MSTTTRTIHATPDAVFDVLSDGWSYSQWVVGASRVRDVTPGWPAEGSHIHHSVGAWPMLIDDATTVRACERPALLELTVRAWPSGEGIVRISCRPNGAGTDVTMEEDATKGPATLFPKAARDLVLDRRNRESLQRLAILAERASAGVDRSAP
ncbi:polyketide cyclase [Terrabacter tumescens]|uniref:Polyketide cyclase n=1 Tax=Terrabacter tumescens TaxID=60443 RepID=A0ABQ2HKI2_9MICO|nr:SRPBCC family protein [Terrabacter tumescens]GGM82205.1 polyketide cyclase [Terrabacter tumescens]